MATDVPIVIGVSADAAIPADVVIPEIVVATVHQPSNNAANRRRIHLCRVCQKQFFSAKGLQQHQIIHTDQKPFLCNICNKAFRFKSNLFEHKSLHSGQLPYVCPLCGKSCRLKGNLKKHLKTHQKCGQLQDIEAACRQMLMLREEARRAQKLQQRLQQNNLVQEQDSDEFNAEPSSSNLIKKKTRRRSTPKQRGKSIVKRANLTIDGNIELEEQQLRVVKHANKKSGAGGSPELHSIAPANGYISPSLNSVGVDTLSSDSSNRRLFLTIKQSPAGQYTTLDMHELAQFSASMPNICSIAPTSATATAINLSPFSLSSANDCVGTSNGHTNYLIPRHAPQVAVVGDGSTAYVLPTEMLHHDTNGARFTASGSNLSSASTSGCVFIQSAADSDEHKPSMIIPIKKEKGASISSSSLNASKPQQRRRSGGGRTSTNSLFNTIISVASKTCDLKRLYDRFKNIPLDTNFVCNACSKNFQSYYDLKLHFEKTHIATPCCFFCLKIFESYAALDMHNSIHNKVASLMPDEFNSAVAISCYNNSNSLPTLSKLRSPKHVR